MSDYLLFKISALEHATPGESCRFGEDILTVICDNIVYPTPTNTPTRTNTPTPTPTISGTPTNTPTNTPSQPTPTPTTTPTITPTNTSTPTVTPSNTSTTTPTPTVTATNTPTPTNTLTPTPSSNPNIVLNLANNWTYAVNGNVILKFTPQNVNQNTLTIRAFINAASLLLNNSLPSVSNIMYGITNYGQLIYNGPIFENKTIQLLLDNTTYSGTITAQNTTLS